MPNTTHIAQATDRYYGLFKSVYQYNLVKLTEYIVSDKSDKKTIQPTDIPLLIFGGGPQEIGLKNAFEDSFGFEKKSRSGMILESIHLAVTAFYMTRSSMKLL